MVLKLYWCRGKGRDDPGQCNFGDFLSPLIVEMAAGRAVEYAPIHKADMMAIGSIMNREVKARRLLLPRRLHVWGSGTDAPGRAFSARHHYHAVRGSHTRDQITGEGFSAVALGDPGLLANEWWSGRPRPGKRYTLGVIPHYVDRDDAAVQRVAMQPGVRIIDVYWPVEDVLKAIQECHFILSSSMHGLIVADAFGIPNRRVVLSQGMISDFKFVDYYSAFGLAEPASLTAGDLAGATAASAERLVGEYLRPGLDGIKRGLLSAFPSL
ncbi:polysaccharide pyruvyl transferase family protein [Pseudothauera nasutitermitis]|uniref:Polysaccharide pyruvyl transferase family protein n=1 Tax=Pseudothauera nasutitermitis TaxID=2565930 RepID=A0A4S4ATD8_9RHOO|nr:polysaccharide pyruvyl transferase family protein [Pseudothauera nasutitermitis]THF63134.1 polysaccharide pyruvyl transferase family protein [Pseudothauera nasutitermitis]